MPKPFHLAWFTNFTPGDWNAPFSHGGSPWDGKFFVEMAQAMERACFDYIMLEDTLMVSEAYRGTAEATLKHVLQVPKHDPMPLAAMIAAATSRMGVVATMSTMAYPPFMLARLSATLDHIAGGRFGWNIVTSGEDAAAQNFGLDKLPPHDMRYEIADEFMDVVNKLFGSWDADAILLDAPNHIGEKGIRNIGNYHADGASATHSQAARHLIGVVIQRIHRLLYALDQLRSDRGFLVEDAGHRSDRHPSQPSDVADCVQLPSLGCALAAQIFENRNQTEQQNSRLELTW